MSVVQSAQLGPRGTQNEDNYQVLVNLTVQGTLVEECLADTGSCRTIISSRIFEGLAEKPEIDRWPGEIAYMD